jgi:peptidoglycan/LPS O-acetylase OafA/YrhL
MILEIVTAILIVLCCANVFMRRRRSKVARIAHISLGITALVAGAAHLASVLPLFEAQPLAVCVSGALLLLVLIGMCLSGLHKHGQWQELHRVLAVAAIVVLI